MAVFSLAALTTEINTDPASLNLATLVAAGNDSGVAAALNAAGAGAAFSIFRKAIAVRDVVANIASADFASLTALQLAKLQLLFAGSATLDATDTNTRTIIVGVFSGMATTVSNLTALAKRQGSRAEVLWGDGTTISANQVSQALGRG